MMTRRGHTRAILMAVTLCLAAMGPVVGLAGEVDDLIGILRSDADTYQKSQACQRLAVVGRDEAVPALAALLGDEQLGAYARSALETIGGPRAAEALLGALGELDGSLRIGAANSLGVLRDASAVPALTSLARGDDLEAACAALEALGRIATPAARDALLGALAEEPAARRAAAAQAGLALGERYVAEDRPAEAVRVYHRIRQAQVPEPLRLAATCRTLVARQAAGIPLLLEQLAAGDPAATMALRAVREMPAPEVTAALRDALAEAPPALQVMLIPAVAERGGEGTRAAILALAAGEDREVRLAALRVLGPVDASQLRFIPLFDGRTFDGWEGDTEGSFRIEDGAIVGGSLDAPVPRNEFLCTTRAYGNFILRLECQVVGANGGVQFRSERVADSSELRGYQADMDSANQYWGCLYDESRRGMLIESDPARRAHLVKPDDWNAYEICCEGQRIRLYLNGELTVDYIETDGGVPVQGIIGLQVHAGGPSETRYRNIALAELP
jgi:HEAT repeat protein